MCEINQGLKRLNFEPLAIVTSIALIQNSNVTRIEETQKLMKAARTGRIGKYPCSNIFSRFSFEFLVTLQRIDISYFKNDPMVKGPARLHGDV